MKTQGEEDHKYTRERPQDEAHSANNLIMRKSISVLTCLVCGPLLWQP